MLTTPLVSLSLLALSLSYFSVRAMAVCHLTLLCIYLLNVNKLRTLKTYKSWILSVLALNTLVLAISAPHDIHFNSYIKFLGFTLYGLLFLTAVRNGMIKRHHIISACALFLITHSLFFLSQLAVHLITGVYLDFDSHIRETASVALYASKALDGLFFSIRATGLFSEPSFYAMTVLPVSLLLSIHQKRLTLVTITGFLTVIASLSVAAMIVSALSLGLVFLIIKSKRLYLIAIFVFIAGFAPSLLTVFERRIFESVDYDAVYSRQVIFKEFKVRDLSENLFGHGFLWNENLLIGKTLMQGHYARDSSFYVYIFFASGALGLLLLLTALAAFAKRNMPYAAALLIIFLFKLHVLSGALWITLILAVVFSHFKPTPEPDYQRA